ETIAGRARTASLRSLRPETLVRCSDGTSAHACGSRERAAAAVGGDSDAEDHDDVVRKEPLPRGGDDEPERCGRLEWIHAESVCSRSRRAVSNRDELFDRTSQG